MISLMKKLHKVITHYWRNECLEIEESYFDTYDAAFINATSNDGHSKIFNEENQLVYVAPGNTLAELYA